MRNLRVRLWEQLGCVVWTGRSDKIAVKLLAETVVPEDLTEAREYAFQVTHVMAVVRRPVSCLLLAGYVQFLTTWASS